MQDPQNDPTPPLTYGLEGKEIPSPSGRGRKMSLTSPLIDQAIVLIEILSLIEIIASRFRPDVLTKRGGYSQPGSG